MSDYRVLSRTPQRIAFTDDVIPIDGIEYKIKIEGDDDVKYTELVDPDGNYLREFGCPHTAVFASFPMIGVGSVLLAIDEAHKTSIFWRDGSIANIFGGPKQSIDDIVKVKGEHFMLADHNVYRLDGSTAFKSPYKGTGELIVYDDEIILDVKHSNLTSTYYSEEGHEISPPLFLLDGYLSKFRSFDALPEFYEAYNRMFSFLGIAGAITMKSVLKAIGESVANIESRNESNPERATSEVKHLLSALKRRIERDPEEFLKEVKAA